MRDELEPLGHTAGTKRHGVDAVHRPGAPDDLLTLEPVGRARVLLDGEGVAAQQDDELAALSRKRSGREEPGDEEAAQSTAHVCFLEKGMAMRVVSQSIWTTPLLPCGTTAMLNCSTGRGNGSVCTFTRTRSESAA